MQLHSIATGKNGLRFGLPFRMASGLVQLAEGSHKTLELISATTADGMVAVAIILAMSFGLIVSEVVHRSL
jgi:hypothetical protein